jgi:hypothetical protein
MVSLPIPFPIPFPTRSIRGISATLSGVDAPDKGPESGATEALTLGTDAARSGIGIGNGNGIGIDPNRIDSGGEVRRYNADP